MQRHLENIAYYEGIMSCSYTEHLAVFFHLFDGFDDVTFCSAEEDCGKQSPSAAAAADLLSHSYSAQHGVCGESVCECVPCS